MLTVINFIQRAVLQGTPLLYGATGEILTEKSGNLNLGIPGIMYIGAISGVVGGFMYQTSTDEVVPVIAVLIPFLCCLLGSLLVSLLYCFLTVTLRANQNVTGLAITTFGVGCGNFFGGSLIKIVKSDVPYLALVDIARAFKTTLPFAESMGDIGKLFFSYGFMVYLAIIIAIISAVFLKRTKHGLNLRAVGENPATADAAGINVTRYKYFATCIGGMIAGARRTFLCNGLLQRHLVEQRLRRPRLACNSDSYLCYLEALACHTRLLSVRCALYSIQLYKCAHADDSADSDASLCGYHNRTYSGEHP